MIKLICGLLVIASLSSGQQCEHWYKYTTTTPTTTTTTSRGCSPGSFIKVSAPGGRLEALRPEAIGEYENLDEMKNGFPFYKHIDNDWYLYFAAQQDGKNIWVLSSALCDVKKRRCPHNGLAVVVTEADTICGLADTDVFTFKSTSDRYSVDYEEGLDATIKIQCCFPSIIKVSAPGGRLG